MPIYEYQCSKCRQISEALQKFSDPPLSECPHCKGKLKKLMSLNSFHLKGSGWYVTDYAGKNAGSQTDSSTGKETTKAEKTDTSTKTESSTESSSASK